MTVSRLFSICCLLSAAAMTVGCGGGSDNPPTYPITGVVTYKEAPVADAIVNFTPIDAAGQGATGQTDSEGRYTLTTFERNDGAMAGQYRVRVFKYDQPASATQSLGSDDEENYVPPDPNARPAAPPKHLLPEIYFSETQTPLRFTVEGTGPQVYDISLEG